MTFFFKSFTRISVIFYIEGLVMKYILKPSLEHIVLIKITAVLWNQNDIRSLMKKFYLSLCDGKARKEDWHYMEDRILEKVQHLPTPGIFMKKILSFVNPIGQQILNWMKYHGDSYFGIDLPNELCWTPQGTIDKKKMAEMLITDENLDIVKRYKLACYYCLEEYIPVIWNRIPDIRKKAFYEDDFPGEVKKDLVLFWTHKMNENMAEIESMIEGMLQMKHSPYRFAFDCAADCGNTAAIEYFLGKLTPEEREESLFSAAGFVKARFRNHHVVNIHFPLQYYIEVLCFLLLQLEEEQQLILISPYTYAVLKAFLDWPWQSFFMDTANRLWNFLDAIHYGCLLDLIIYKVKCGYKDWDYQTLFGEFWRQSPNAHKEFCIGRCTSGEILPDLFKIGDIENIKLILKNATVKEKQEIIFNYNAKNICVNLVYANNDNILKFFLQECITSRNAMVKFKKEFAEHIEFYHSNEKLEKEKDLWSKFFQFLDDIV